MGLINYYYLYVIKFKLARIEVNTKVIDLLLSLTFDLHSFHFLSFNFEDFFFFKFATFISHSVFTSSKRI